MAQLFTTQYGINCRPVNPNQRYKPVLYEFGMVKENNYEWDDFEQTVQHYSIHSPNPIKGEFWGEVVWQIETTKKWSTITDAEYEIYKNSNAVLRQAVQPVPVNGEEKVQSKLSVEEAAEHPLEMQIVNRVRTMVEDMQDRVSEFFIEVAKEYTGNPMCEVKTYNQTDDRLSILKIDDRTVATVIESRTDFNNVEWIFSKLLTHALTSSNMVELERVVEVLTDLKGLFRNRACFDTAITQIKNLTKEFNAQ